MTSDFYDFSKESLACILVQITLVCITASVLDDFFNPKNKVKYKIVDLVSLLQSAFCPALA